LHTLELLELLKQPARALKLLKLLKLLNINSLKHNYHEKSLSFFSVGYPYDGFRTVDGGDFYRARGCFSRR
jgi:hypothetical protein